MSHTSGRTAPRGRINDGGCRTDAARIGGVGLQTIRWVLRFNARGPDGLLNAKAPGDPCKLNNTQRKALAPTVESGPIRRVLIPTRTERHALAQSRRPMGMTRYSLRSENPGMSQPSRGLV